MKKATLNQALIWWSSLTTDELNEAMSKRFLPHVLARKLSNQQIKKLYNDFYYEPFKTVNLDNLKMDIDFQNSVNIYYDLGDAKDPIHICYWYFEEWEEDAELVVPAMLNAINLFLWNKQMLLDTLKIDLKEILTNIK